MRKGRAEGLDEGKNVKKKISIKITENAKTPGAGKKYSPSQEETEKIYIWQQGKEGKKGITTDGRSDRGPGKIFPPSSSQGTENDLLVCNNFLD